MIPRPRRDHPAIAEDVAEFITNGSAPHSVADVHRAAMHESGFADGDRWMLDPPERISGEIVIARLTAVILETQCALRTPFTPESEPTRAILYRSAAWLAVNLAGALAREGLAGHPPVQEYENLCRITFGIAAMYRGEGQDDDGDDDR